MLESWPPGLKGERRAGSMRPHTLLYDRTPTSSPYNSTRSRKVQSPPPNPDPRLLRQVCRHVSYLIPVSVHSLLRTSEKVPPTPIFFLFLVGSSRGRLCCSPVQPRALCLDQLQGRYQSTPGDTLSAGNWSGLWRSRLCDFAAPSIPPNSHPVEARRPALMGSWQRSSH